MSPEVHLWHRLCHQPTVQLRRVTYLLGASVSPSRQMGTIIPTTANRELTPCQALGRGLHISLAKSAFKTTSRGKYRDALNFTGEGAEPQRGEVSCWGPHSQIVAQKVRYQILLRLESKHGVVYVPTSLPTFLLIL